MIPTTPGADASGMGESTDVERYTGEPAELAKKLGLPIAGMEGRLPAATLSAWESWYPAGRHVRLNVEVMVKGWKFEICPDGRVMFQHLLSLVSAQIVSNFDPVDASDTVVGSASAHPVPTDEDAAEIGGLQIRRTSDMWAS